MAAAEPSRCWLAEHRANPPHPQPSTYMAPDLGMKPDVPGLKVCGRDISVKTLGNKGPSHMNTNSAMSSLMMREIFY